MASGPKMRRRLGLAAAALGTALGAGAGTAWWALLRRPLPRTEGRLSVPGIEGPVEVRRDRWGVPHIRAENRNDLWFGQGFCLGQDRLWQLELIRRVASGRVAELAGPPGLPSDRLMRTLGFRRVAEGEARELDPAVAAQLEAFCQGVAEGARSLRVPPVEFRITRSTFEPWRPVDMLTCIKLLSLGLSTNWERELLRAEMVRAIGEERTARLDPAYPVGNPVVVRPGEPWDGEGGGVAGQIDRVRRYLGMAVEATGSNNWAVAGSRSATGGPLVAGDPHLPPSMPGITYQVCLYHGDRFARGAALPGFPGLLFGQNNDVAWTFTNVLADVMDLFIERIDGDTYEFEGERRPLTVTEEEIRVRGREPERLVVRETHHGPIVNEALGADDAEPLALRFSVLDLPGLSEGPLSVLDWAGGAELVASAESHMHPVSNCVWADRHGHIGYKTVGRLPIRRGGCPDLPKPGWTGEYEWEGWVPYDEMPAVTDPDAGYLVTANNRIVGDDYPHHITSDYLDGYRARRITELIESVPEHDLATFGAMQLDMVSIPGLETAHRLTRLEVAGQRETAAIERLRSWDGVMGPDSVAATIYQAFTLHFARTVARELIGDRDLAERWLDRADNGFLTHVTSPWRWQAHLLALWDEGDTSLLSRGWDELAVEGLRAALDDLENRYGPDPSAWRWGRVHPLRFEHALGSVNPLFARIFNRVLEPGGSQDTVAQVGWDPGDPFTAIWAPCWRMVADPLHPERSRWQQFAGQSGHPASPHYDDLQERWLRGEMQPMAGEGPWRALALEPADGA